MIGTHHRGELASLDRATGWLNSEPLTADRLRGRPVLVDFWTYTCINWLRTLPYVRAWADRYADRGLVTIGVHTPEFSFERDEVNIRREVADMRVTYPVAIDSDYEIWQGFSNHYWPALYLLDGDGRMRHHHFGEGEYVRSEEAIQQVLGISEDLVDVEPAGIEAAADWDTLRTPESYLGFARSENLATFTGDWTVGSEAAVLNAPGGRVVIPFQARDVHLVMGPAARGDAIPFQVLIDGQPPGAAHGLDVDAHGNGVLTEQRLHQLVRQSGPIIERSFEIVFADPGAEVYVFTFG
jgi:thiol-disulfide isomerase/thioredoxin